jgi:hypothetical protein
VLFLRFDTSGGEENPDTCGVSRIDLPSPERHFRTMIEERGDIVDLAYIGRALQRLTTEVGSLRDDIKVLTAIVLRHDKTLIRVLEQITAMVTQNARIIDRLRAVEDRVGALEGSR